MSQESDDEVYLLPVRTLRIRLSAMAGFALTDEFVRADAARFAGIPHRVLKNFSRGSIDISHERQMKLSLFFHLLERGLLAKHRAGVKITIERLAPTPEQMRPRSKVDFMAGKVEWAR